LSGARAPLGPPADAVLAAFLDRHAPLTPVPACGELRAFTAGSLVRIWEAAESLAGDTLPSPFWAFPWPAGVALARTILERPDRVAGRRVIDIGAGGGVTSFACAMAGAAVVVACDVDPWALAVTRIGATRQALRVETLELDVTVDPGSLDGFDVVLCADLAYDASAAERERKALSRAAVRGSTVLVADAGRTYFEPAGLELLREWTIAVTEDLEGCRERLARVYRWPISTRPVSRGALRSPRA